MTKWALISIVLLLSLDGQAHGFGIIKDIYQKITNTNNKTENIVKQSAPICGSGAFSTPNENSLSPEVIFISNQASRAAPANSNNNYDNKYNNNNNNQRESYGDYLQRRRNQPTNEIAKEFGFHTENVTIEELEKHGFNRDAPVSFLMHGFTSGYPLQAWISAIVESYTLDRKSGGSDGASSSSSPSPYTSGRSRGSSSQSSGQKVDHNLFIVNWNYAARGILYPRAVANIPIVASFITRFINDKLIQEAGVNPKQIQLVGHSLGAHLAGYVGKNTQSKLGRIYGLDPAGPCFGAIAGPLYPSSRRLAPSDADEVISVHTNSALLGIDKPLGRYSVFVEGGEKQPGCKGGGVLSSLNSLTFDGGDFDSVACSHSRAPNLFTYRHSQDNADEDCQMVAYACKDWESFSNGQCGVCSNNSNSDQQKSGQSHNLNKRGLIFGGGNSSRQEQQRNDPLEPVECLLIGLDWQYSGNDQNNQNGADNNQDSSSPNKYGSSSSNSGNDNGDRDDTNSNYPMRSSTRRPSLFENSNDDRESISNENRRNQTRRNNLGSNGNDRNRRDNNSSAQRGSNNDKSKEDRESTTGARGDNSNEQVEPISLFMKTADTQPYCAFHYQIVLELNEPFEGRGKPPMAIILQDSRPDREAARRRGGAQLQQNSLSDDAFGNKFNDRTYTHLLTSGKKLRTVDHATIIFRSGLEDGHRILKALHVNYMSHSDPKVRRRLSSRLCPVTTDTDRSADKSSSPDTRFYFEPCYRQRNRHTTAYPYSYSYSSSSSSSSSARNQRHRDSDDDD